jgi:hypothetical protein
VVVEVVAEEAAVIAGVGAIVEVETVEASVEVEEAEAEVVEEDRLQWWSSGEPEFHPVYPS